ncbi:hypothetical protein GCM10010420_24760 [Streptomyces glaucosporus]|uniref:Uncharacterized protein n=1 Tax=Streptomyces glaucosporus TaxID=284044 RepID=A0ABP5VA77_9ACTN
MSQIDCGGTGPERGGRGRPRPSPVAVRPSPHGPGAVRASVPEPREVPADARRDVRDGSAPVLRGRFKTRRTGGSAGLRGGVGVLPLPCRTSGLEEGSGGGRAP